MSRDDHERIAAMVNRNRPGAGRFVAMPKMSHGYFVHDTLERSFQDHDSGTFHEPVVTLIVDWLKENVAAR